jgi:hypothetical protein
MLLDRNAAWMLTTRATGERVNRDALAAPAGGEHRGGGGLGWQPWAAPNLFEGREILLEVDGSGRAKFGRLG